MEFNELEELDALVNSEGWHVFRRYVESEWGPAGARFLSGVTAAANDTADADATARLRQIVVAQREIQKLMTWVPERLKHLKATQPSLESDGQPLSRRGGL